MIVRMFQALLFGIALSLWLVGLYSQNMNHVESNRQVQVILDADLAGQPVADKITMLRAYVKNHLGATIDFSLTGAFNRAQVAAQAYTDAVARAQQANSEIYAQAQAACAGIKNAISQTKCNQDYLNSHLQDVHIPDPVPVPVESDYYYKLISPPWTADVAGALYVDAVITLVLAIIGLIFIKDPHR